MFQDANVAGRNYVTDDRWGGFVSTKWTPTNDIKITTNYVHTDLSGLPDFGVPWYKQGGTPVTEVPGISRKNWYGFVNRDFQTARQDFGTLTGEYKVTDSITLTSRTRAEHSMLAYIGTLPNAPQTAHPNPVTGRSPPARRAATSGSTSWRTRKRRRSSSIPERSSIRRWSGSKSPTSASGSTATPAFRRKRSERAPPGNGALPNQSIYAPKYTFLPFGTFRR